MVFRLFRGSNIDDQFHFSILEFQEIILETENDVQ